MKITGIIAEYNPFHNGHLYQMQEARRLSGADYIIVAMSPDFVQRGIPAFFDKWARARMALEAGADLVLELPVRTATGSAEFFAHGGVSLLSSLGVVDALSFGCETDNLAPLERFARFLSEEEPDEYRQRLQEMLREGKNYAEARCDAYLEYCRRHSAPPHLSVEADPSEVNPVETDTVEANTAEADPSAEGGPSDNRHRNDPAEDLAADILRSPNNILAIEYLKAIRRTGSHMQPYPVLRVGAGYHDLRLAGYTPAQSTVNPVKTAFASASGIRSALLCGIDVRNHMPPEAARIMCGEMSENRYLTTSALDLSLHLKLYESRNCLADYLDVSEDLANRMEHLLSQYTGFDQFTALLKTKQIAHTRIRRALLHILLGLKKEQLQESACQNRTVHTERAHNLPQYARVLGFRKSAQPLLSRIKEKSCIPLITKLPPESRIPEALQEDLKAAELWEILVSNKTGAPVRNERQRQIIILPL